jgi:hypothetical protein
MGSRHKYADVVVARWEQLTGKKATLDGDGRTFEETKVGRLGSQVED